MEDFKDDLIMSFLHGELSVEEEKDFMKRLELDPDLRRQAISMARLHKGINQVGEENDKNIQEAFLSLDKESIIRIARRHTFKLKWIVSTAVAASLIFGFSGYKYYDYRVVTSLGEKYALQYEKHLTRGAEETPRAELEVETLVENVYCKKDLVKTLERLAILWELATMETYNDYSDYVSEIGWALTTGYLKNNDRDAAKEQLEKMGKIFDSESHIGGLISELSQQL